MPEDSAVEAAPAPAPAASESSENNGSSDLAWLTPRDHGTPAQALARIRVLCQQFPDLHSALLAVLATHQGLARELLGTAIKQFRRDLDDLSSSDVAALLTSIWNGGKQGFEATLRSRRKGDRKAAAMSWVKSDD